MMSSAKIKRLEISTPQGEAGLLEKRIALRIQLHPSRQGSGDIPDHAAPRQFGRTVCSVSHPEAAIERIATAMEEVLRDEAHRVDGSFLARMKNEWDNGAASVQAPKFFQA